MSSSNDSSPTRRKAHDDVEFLAGSWNRLDILEIVTDGPRTRNELKEVTDVSRVTLSRILSDLEEQGWIARTGGGYETTSAGAFVAEEVSRLLDNLRTLNRLGDNVEWIRLDQFEFDLRCLQDAEIIMPSWDDFAAQTRILVNLVYESTTLKGLGAGLDREFMQAVADASINGELSLELIFTPKIIDAVNDEPELSRLFRDLADTHDATIYQYKGEDALMELGIHETEASSDDVVMLCGEYEEGAPPGTVKTTDPKVRDWAQSHFEARKAESVPLKAAVFTR